MDLAVRVADGQPPFETLALPVGVVFQAGEQGAPDPVERVVLVAAAVQGLLLYPPPDFVEDVGGQLDDVEGVEDGGGVG